MKFQNANLNFRSEREGRKGLRAKALTFGINFLDDALIGIMPTDLILLGAPAGVGKTQFCCNIALANVAKGKRVHYIALEAEELEIERRIKYQMVAEKYFSYPKEIRDELNDRIAYDKWYAGDFYDGLADYDEFASSEFNEKYKSLNIMYKEKDFGINELIEKVLLVSQETDLIIVDHVHYFDFDDDNENKAMKEIAKTARMLALEQKIPIILVAHLRKRDRNNKQLVASMEEFHGSSDLYKIATKVVTFAPGPVIAMGKYQGCLHTFFRIPKNRLNGSVTRYIASVPFNLKGNCYEKEYRLSSSDVTEFSPMGDQHYPGWARGYERASGVDLGSLNRAPTTSERQVFKGYIQGLHDKS